MIPDGYRHNFNQLLRAARNNDLALVETTRKRNGKPVFVVCAITTKDDGSVFMIPMAMMFDGDPFAMLNPPAPEVSTGEQPLEPPPPKPRKAMR